jgi:S-adenosylmethionine-diacylglycerol 3-amino-3-carboxypropyl transferase
MGSEVAVRADFSGIRYGQCWEDADVLLEGLAIEPGDTCLSIASAGDNALAMLTRSPGRVIALDFSPAQLACLELRVAGYRELCHAELLELIGSVPSRRRLAIYRRCRAQLSPTVRAFWDSRPKAIGQGIGGAGKFENYFALFRRRLLPLVHRGRLVHELLRGGTLEERKNFYRRRWDTLPWRLLFGVFFSRFIMGRLGRDPSFFQYVEGSVAERIRRRTEHALTMLDPAANPYLQWILTGRHGHALPLALRAEHFETIRANLDRLEWRCQSVEDFLEECGPHVMDRYNLSDIFEYMSEATYYRLLNRLAVAGRRGGRLAYWNMLAPRSRPEPMAGKLCPLTDLAARLHREDKAFFYSRFVVEEIL